MYISYEMIYAKTALEIFTYCTDTNENQHSVGACIIYNNMLRYIEHSYGYLSNNELEIIKNAVDYLIEKFRSNELTLIYEYCKISNLTELDDVDALLYE